MVRREGRWAWAFLGLLTACTTSTETSHGAGGATSAGGSTGSTTGPTGTATGSTSTTGTTTGATTTSTSVSGSGTGGSAGASTSGAGGQAGSSGAGGAAGSAGSGAGGAIDAGGGDAGDYPPLVPCTAPSVSRLKVWEMQVVGGTQVPTGSPLRKVGNDYELFVTWTLTGSGAYGTANAPLNNMGEFTNGADPAKNAVDISGATGIFLEYGATGNTYMQIRTGTVPHGGDHFRATMPVTGTDVKTITLNFADFRRPGGTTPPGPDVLKDVFSFTFVGGATTTLTLRQVRIRGFTPPCN